MYAFYPAELIVIVWLKQGIESPGLKPWADVTKFEDNSDNQSKSIIGLKEAP